MTISADDLRRRRRRLLRLMRLLFTLQLALTLVAYGTLVDPPAGPLNLAVLLSGIGVALLQPRVVFQWLGRARWLYLPLLVGFDLLHIVLVLWSRPLAELARGSLWALTFLPILLVAGRWWGHRGAGLLLALVLLADGLVLFVRLPLSQALPVFIFQGVLFALSAFITSLAEMRLRRETALREELTLSERRLQLANRIHEEMAEQIEQLEALLRELGERPATLTTSGPLEEAKTVARNLQETIQRSLRDVRPTPLAVRTLPEALARETEALSRALGIECRFRYAGHLPELRPATAQYLFRATQEALANIRRHAGAQAVAVELDHDQNDVVLQVSDDGLGFDPGAVESSGSAARSLLDLQAGVADLGGTLTIESRPGGGTRIEVRIPAAGW